MYLVLRRAAYVGLLAALSTTSAAAADFTVPAGTTDPGTKTVGGTDQGTIESGATLETSGTSITQSGASTGVIIDNFGTLRSGNRGIDTSGGSATRTITLNNHGEISTSDDTFRVNTDVTNGTITVNNFGSMTSASGQILDFASMSSSAAIVSIDNSGTMQAFGHDALRVGGGTIEIRNTGSILATDSVSRAINMNYGTAIASFTLYNGEDGVIRSIDDAVRFSDVPTVGQITIENHGTIESIGTGDDAGQALDLNTVRATGISIKNYGLIQTQDADAIRPGQGGVVENWGTIIGRAVDPNDSSDGIDFQDTNAGEVINHAGGVIEGARHGITGKLPTTVTNEAGGLIKGNNGSGLNFDTLAADGPMTVINYGAIVGVANPDADYGDGDGVDIDAIGHIYNYGIIRGEGSIGTKEGDLLTATSEAIAIGGGIIVNGSTAYRDALISGVDNGILVDDSETGNAFEAIAIANYGRIEGLDGFGIRIISAEANVIENFGTISGSNGVAVEFGVGDDLFVHHAGATVEGYVDGGDGSDTLRLGTETGAFDLAAIGDAATYRNFETFGISGVWTLRGTTAFSGETRIEDAAALLDDAGLSGSDVHVVDGMLLGTGTLGSLTAVGADISPGSADGTPGSLDVVGDVSFDAASSLTINVRGVASSINSEGAIAIEDGASLIVQGTGGCAPSAPCTILSSVYGITGTFDVDNRLAFLDANVDYIGNDAFLELARNGASFESVGRTRNQRSVGRALDDSGSGSPLYDEAVGMTEAGARHAFNQLSGDTYASQVAVTAQEEVTFAGLLLGRLQDFSGKSGASNKASPYAPPYRLMPAPSDGGPAMASGAWATVTGQSIDMDGDGNAFGVTSRSGGVAAGFDARWEATQLGIAASFSSGRTRTDGRFHEIEGDTVRIAAYGATQLADLVLKGGVSAGWTSYDSDRWVQVGGISESARGSYDGHTTSAFAEASYPIAMQAFKLEPFAGLMVTNVDSDSFTERGAPSTGLWVGGNDETLAFSTLGLRFASVVHYDGAALIPKANIGWRHAFDGDPIRTAMQLPTGSEFSVEGLPIAEDSVTLGLGLEGRFASGITLGIGYQGDFADDASSHSGQAGIRVPF
ncbi:autotransporter outer membrane beta-barrel domain-containing protein [Hyphomicrobium sp. CS1GBMeth3]|uniref:autotransporter outer membrane beta-barrel domain-containing protein n=1 Tax=Hyphomicrobium sp. CS1GBMeth3 TaxID=1892845 RepID=UPI0009318ECF|nr:autotransporter outer membrane beta-barrel domain-containing protein [Hyphomicrobium sp. CS1GBMeth3]